MGNNWISALPVWAESSHSWFVWFLAAAACLGIAWKVADFAHKKAVESLSKSISKCVRTEMSSVLFELQPNHGTSFRDEIFKSLENTNNRIRTLNDRVETVDELVANQSLEMVFLSRNVAAQGETLKSINMILGSGVIDLRKGKYEDE